MSLEKKASIGNINKDKGDKEEVFKMFIFYFYVEELAFLFIVFTLQMITKKSGKQTKLYLKF